MSRVIYASLPAPKPIGGVRVLTQHVELLRAAGHDAWLWLPRADERPQWFDDNVPSVFGATTEIAAEDLLVLAEVPVVHRRDPAPGARKVIFNQNHFYTFAAGVPEPGGSYPGWEPSPAVWTVSAESREVLSSLHANLPVAVVPNPVDLTLFAPSATKRPSIAWIPRKRAHEASLIKWLLSHDDRFADVELHEIVNLPITEVAAILATTTVFLNLGHSEGFGLPMAEALAAGCLVAGYDGGGGTELFDAPGTWRVPEQRPLLLVEQAARLLLGEPAELVQAAALGAQNRAWVAERYSPDITTRALRTQVESVLSRPGRAAGTQILTPAASGRRECGRVRRNTGAEAGGNPRQSGSSSLSVVEAAASDLVGLSFGAS